jgi:tetratricopeptide (TPR) repeat protein
MGMLVLVVAGVCLLQGMSSGKTPRSSGFSDRPAATADADEDNQQPLEPKQNSADDREQLSLAESYFESGKCGLALSHYARADGELPGNPDAILHYAQCAQEQGSASQAVSILGLLPQRDGARHFAAGEMLVEHQAYAAAAGEFGLARQTYRDPYTAGFDQALAYFKAGDFPKTLDTANDLLNQGHRTAELANLAGEAYLRNKQPQDGYNALRLAASLDPKNEDNYLDLCSLTLDLDEYDLGMEIANLGLTHVPNSARLYVQRGVLRAMKGQFDEAQQDFATAARLAPHDASPRVSEGVLAMQRGDLDQSIALLRQATALSPGNYLAQFWFAEAMLRSGVALNGKEGDETLTALQHSVRSNAEFWHSQTDLGKVLLERGDPDAAIGHLEKAAALNPSATNPLYLLAQVYLRKGDRARAQELMDRVSKMQEEDRESLARSDLKQVAAEGTPSAPQLR